MLFNKLRVLSFPKETVLFVPPFERRPSGAEWFKLSFSYLPISPFLHKKSFRWGPSVDPSKKPGAERYVLIGKSNRILSLISDLSCQAHIPQGRSAVFFHIAPNVE
jgi:hypothetical protein